MTITLSVSCQDISINKLQTPTQAQDDLDVKHEDGTTTTIYEEDTGQCNQDIQTLGSISSKQSILQEQPEVI
jgi:hypothetical protein